MTKAEKERLARVGKTFNAKKYIKEEIEAIRAQVGDKKVLLAMSGGVDSSVCAVLLQKAIGKQLTCVFVDHGYMRLNAACPRSILIKALTQLKQAIAARRDKD